VLPTRVWLERTDPVRGKRLLLFWSAAIHRRFISSGWTMAMAPRLFHTDKTKESGDESPHSKKDKRKRR
jgi:hypothetical protein